MLEEKRKNVRNVSKEELWAYLEHITHNKQSEDMRYYGIGDLEKAEYAEILENMDKRR